MRRENEAQLVRHIAERHQASVDAVKAILAALKARRGRAARFTHPDFGGDSRWSPEGAVIADMSDDRLKSKLDAIATDLRGYLRTSPDALPKDTLDGV